MFALINLNACRFYFIDPIQTNAAVKHSFEFTLNRVLFKIFGAFPTDTYRHRPIGKYFGVDPIQEMISDRRSKFILRYCASEGDVCRAISELP